MPRMWRLRLTILLLLTLLPAGFPVTVAAQERAPDFALINQDGATVRLSQFRGRLVLLTFLYTHCVDVCPLTTAKLTTVQNELKKRGWFGTRVMFLSMTFDPRRDTPTALKSYAGKFKVDHRGWHFLSGPPVTVLKVIQAYRIPVKPASKPGLIDHGLPTLVIDRQGRILGHYDPDFDPHAVIRDLAALLGH